MSFTFADKPSYTPFKRYGRKAVERIHFYEHFPLVITGRNPTTYGYHGAERLLVTRKEMWPLAGRR